MTARLRKALRLATQAGGAAAFAGLVNVVITPQAPEDHGKLFYAVVVPLLSFAFFFMLIFPLAYAFPPRSENLALRQEFPGARRIIWPLVILASALVVWLVTSNGN